MTNAILRYYPSPRSLCLGSCSPRSSNRLPCSDLGHNGRVRLESASSTGQVLIVFLSKSAAIRYTAVLARRDVIFEYGGKHSQQAKVVEMPERPGRKSVGPSGYHVATNAIQV